LKALYLNLFFVFYYGVTTTFAIDLSLIKNDSAKASISLSGSYYSQSTVLTNAFVNKFILFPGFIDEGLKGVVSSHLKRDNQFGFAIDYGFSYFQKFNHRDFGFFITAKDKQYLNTKFSGDFYNLLMYGNKRFAGTTAAFDGLSLNALKYQKLGTGLIWTVVDTVGKLGFGFSYLNGESNSSLNAEKARLFTSEDGQYLNFETAMTWNMNDTMNRSRFANNGFGFSADLFFEAPFKLKRRSGKMVVSVEDIGFIKWNSSSRSYSVDSTFYFDGIDVSNIFQLRDSVFSSISADSAISKFSNKGKKNITTLVPASFNFYTITNYGKRFQLVKGIHHIFNANYKLKIYANGNIIFSINFLLVLG